jgi:hypothetical protein
VYWRAKDPDADRTPAADGADVARRDAGQRPLTVPP